MFVFIISLIVTFVLFFNWLEDNKDEDLKKYLIRTFIISCTSLVLYVFTPSERQAYMV